MIDASFINLPDNVPFSRVYKTRKGFFIGIRNMKNAKFLWALDYDRTIMIYPEDLNKERNNEGKI